MKLWDSETDYQTGDNADAVTARMSGMVDSLGLDYFSFMFLKSSDHCTWGIDTTFHTNYPVEWVDRYIARKYWEVDPVAVLGRRSIRPFSWGQGPFLRDFEKPQRVVFDECREYKIMHGVTIPVRGTHGELSVFNLASSHEQHFKEVMKSAGSRIMSAAFDTHDLVLEQANAGQAASGAEIGLSPREKECLSWTLEGKTAGEIASILGISVSTVNQHAHSASNKLGSLNKHHAAVQALRQRLI